MKLKDLVNTDCKTFYAVAIFFEKYVGYPSIQRKRLDLSFNISLASMMTWVEYIPLDFSFNII